MASPSKPEILIAALSARALAEAARAAGYAPLVADLFGDDDTCAVAEATELVAGDFATGFNPVSLGDALRKLSAGRAPVGLVYGSGFEANPALLAKLNVLGNSPATLKRLKAPAAFAADCKRLGIPHPAVSELPPGSGQGWLAKMAGASGGDHIRQGGGRAEPGRYYQRFVDGMPVSALFAADGAEAQLLGFSRQWCAPTPEMPYRFGGAVQPSGLEPARLEPLADAVAKLAREYKLKGLNSADFIVADDGQWLLEVNPRPGATMDIFKSAIPGLFARHIAACEGRFLDAPTPSPRFCAHAIAYASANINAVPAVAWPDWASDRQPAGTAVSKDAPLCSVNADGGTAMDAIAGTTARIQIMRAQLERRTA